MSLAGRFDHRGSVWQRPPARPFRYVLGLTEEQREALRMEAEAHGVRMQDVVLTAMDLYFKIPPHIRLKNGLDRLRGEHRPSLKTLGVIAPEPHPEPEDAQDEGSG